MNQSRTKIFDIINYNQILTNGLWNNGFVEQMLVTRGDIPIR